MPGSTRVSRYQKGKTKKVKTNLDLLEQEIVSGSGICWKSYMAYWMVQLSITLSESEGHFCSFAPL